MAIVRATESPRFDRPGVHFFGLLAPGRGSTELCTWRLEVDPVAGANGESHQLDHEEVFVILEGSLTITIDGQPFDLGAGDALAVPAGRSALCMHPQYWRGFAVANGVGGAIIRGMFGRLGWGRPTGVWTLARTDQFDERLSR